MGDSAPATPILDTQLFRDAFNASPIGIAVENLDGQPLFVNPAFCSFLGFSEEELRNKHCVDFSPSEDAEKDWALFQQLRAGSIDNYQLDKRYFRRDGSLVWGRLSISLLNSRPSALVLAMIEDITERKAAQEARLRLAAIVEASNDAIIGLDLDGTVVDWNRGAEQLFGYSAGEAVGEKVSFLSSPDRHDEVRTILKKVSSGEGVKNYKTVRRRKDGSRVDICLTLSPIGNEVGRIVGMSGIVHDITEQKRAEEALRVSEERLRLAQQAAGIGSFEWNVRTGAESWTPELEAMYGLPPGGFRGTHSGWINLIHADDLAEVQRLADETLKTGRPMTGEWRVVWPDESVHWIAGRWQVFMDEYGKPWRVLGVNIDITERRRTEDALVELNRTLEAQSALLQSREELLNIFVKNVPVAVAMLDREMRYLQVSDRWCSDNSVEASEILGRFRYEAPEMPEHLKEANRRALQGETLRADEDCWQSGGSTRWGRWEVRPWRNPDGTVGGILVFAEDITRRKQMEEALSDLSRKLIESQEQERARIGRELHDDINQRLAMLSLELEQLQENPSEIQPRVKELRRQMAEVSNDVQALSHDLHSSKLEYLGVVAGMKSWCKEFAERHGIEIDFSSDVSSVLPLAVGLSLFRVLQEALNNAIKHSGVKRIAVELHEEADEIHLTIRDLGKGFDIEAARQGRGLGLTSMQERVRLMNGTITIQSKPMGGTTIHVSVPLAAEHGAERAAG